MAHEVSFPLEDRELAGLVDDAGAGATAAFVLGHGANNDMRHPFLEGIATAMTARGVSVLRFNFPYKSAGRGYPDRPPVLMGAWRAAVQAAAQRFGLPVAAGGKSLGGRIASMVAAEDGAGFPVRALVFFGYPLHAPGKSDQPRVEHLDAVAVPMLFIEGTKDPLARFDLIEGLVGGLGPAKARLHVVDGGDHSFRVRGGPKRADQEVGRELGEVAAAFVHEMVG
jgi:predicted alpha/beta-hydrolase family hydrolase